MVCDQCQGLGKALSVTHKIGSPSVLSTVQELVINRAWITFSVQNNVIVQEREDKIIGIDVKMTLPGGHILHFERICLSASS